MLARDRQRGRRDAAPEQPRKERAVEDEAEERDRPQLSGEGDQRDAGSDGDEGVLRIADDRRQIFNCFIDLFVRRQ